jgi:Tol biopolymer transport system component/imidazolonepropionase-like amidohydrolase
MQRSSLALLASLALFGTEAGDPANNPIESLNSSHADDVRMADPSSPDQARTRHVVVNEGTSMSVAASPDGQTLAIDLQGSLWTLPVGGGTAKRITDEYNDARQPTWSADGRTIAFQGYRDGGYDIWAVESDGTKLRKLTSGPYDDREPAWSRDGSRIAFSSDRSGNYDVWVLHLTSGKLEQVTNDPGDDYMPSWSPDGTALVFIGARSGALGVQAITLATREERRLTTPRARVDAPSWGPSGEIVYHASGANSSRLESNGESLTGDENAFAFRVGWLSGREFVYTADGKIRRRALGRASATEIPFAASLTVTPARYAKQRRDVDTRAPRSAVGVVGPAVSPDGRQVAFAALGDLYLMAVGGAPRNLTNDAFLDAEPAWSPDGRYLAWSTDRGGALLDLWVRDMVTGQERRLTDLPTSEMGAAWSPDGTRIAFLDVDGIWRRANVSVVDVATGKVTQIHAPLFGPGNPTWSPDGQHVALTALTPYSARFREGTNQVLVIPAGSTGTPRWHTPVTHLSIDSRVGAGPVWSPDGSRMAVVYEGMLAVLPVARDGTPTGPPRRLTSEIAHAPSWTGDSRSMLYQSNDRLRLVDVESGEVRDVPLALRYTPSLPTGRVVVHAGTLVDGRSSAPRRDVDLIIDGNRIRAVTPHASANHRGSRLVDASRLTVMPGLIEYHTHLQKDLGEASMRAYLAFGITTVRSPGGTPYEAAEDREAVDAGRRPGPRLFTTGYLMEWQRVYYKMAVAVSSNVHLDLELNRARALRHDLLKSYVRMPDLQQRRMVAFAHAAGLPAASHEVFPAALTGMDGTEHTTGTSRRGYSPKAATLQRSYADVASLFAASGMPITPTLALGGGGMRRLVEKDTSLRGDPRFALYPPWLSATVTGAPGAGVGAPPGAVDPNAGGQMVMTLMRAGTKIVAGTDTPNAATLHGELYSYVLAGMTPYEALRTATVNSAEQLGIDAGVVTPGSLADLTIVEGNPLNDITATTRVRYTIANGRVFRVSDLLTAVGAGASSGR